MLYKIIANLANISNRHIYLYLSDPRAPLTSFIVMTQVIYTYIYTFFKVSESSAYSYNSISQKKV